MTRKTGAFSGVAVLAAGVAVATYILLRPAPTPETVKNPVDERYEQLTVRLNDLDMEVRQADANVDSLARLLEAVRWEAPETGTEYERQKRNLYLDTKKNVAMTFYTVINERGLNVSSPLLDDIEGISE